MGTACYEDYAQFIFFAAVPDSPKKLTTSMPSKQIAQIEKKYRICLCPKLLIKRKLFVYRESTDKYTRGPSLASKAARGE